MKLSILFLSGILFSFHICAQSIKAAESDSSSEIQIPMKAEYWESDTATTEFITYKNTSVIKGKKGNAFQVFLKDHHFSNGTIEFDVEFSGMGFPGINFRMSKDRKNGENFYIRYFGAINPQTRTTLQYAALMDGMSIWDLTDEYQAGAVLFENKWNHVKLVISGKQMGVYVNDMTRPALVVPELEGGVNAGGISLSGNVIYANFTLKPNATENLKPESGHISTAGDTRYLRDWMVAPARDFPFGREITIALPSMYGKLTASELPDSNTKWSAIKAEARGIVNLTRIYGLKENDVRRLTWLKTTIQSDKDQEKILNFGFNDEVWLFLNGQIVYVDKNYFGTPSQKSPEGRCTIENATIKLPLREGKNEIMIALANYFYGWGIIARLDNTEGIIR